ncbi:MAG: restriction endonuclease subunit S, partial [Eubacteriaceae bacterium]|nr:restriction endonuclease subunit S [Eubacteriaceae bacterium]
RQTDRQTDRQAVVRLCQYVFGYADVRLAEIAEYRKQKINAADVDENSYIGVDNLLPNKAGRKQSEYVPTEGRLIRFEENDILIGNIRPYLKKIWLSDCFGGTNGDVLAIGILNKAMVYPRYLYYVLSSDEFFAYDNQHAKGAKMPRGNKDAVMRYRFALPIYAEQVRIAGLLDRFDKLCHDISEGLPAEIAARQKQYEYYRDQLLSFKEA